MVLGLIVTTQSMRPALPAAGTVIGQVLPAGPQPQILTALPQGARLFTPQLQAAPGQPMMNSRMPVCSPLPAMRSLPIAMTAVPAQGTMATIRALGNSMPVAIATNQPAPIQRQNTIGILVITITYSAIKCILSNLVNISVLARI